MYPEVDELHTGNDGEVASLIGTPGLSLLATIGNGPIRGSWFTTTGAFYVVSGNTVYSVTSAWVATSVGTIATTTGPVGMADNGIQLVIVDGPNGYYLTLKGGGSLVQIININWQGSNTVTYQDGYFIFTIPNSNETYLSDLNDITFTAPAVSGRNGYPDNIVATVSSNRNLWLFGDETTEVWYNSGDNLVPFQYIQGTFTQIGCAAQFSAIKMANTVFWLGKDETGTGMVYMASGFAAIRISTHAVELAIQGYSTISDAIAFSYQENGHQFYVLTFPTASATWCFDTQTQLWHERGYTDQGVLERIRANCYSAAFGIHVVGDYANGNIYQMSSSVYSDNGNPITRLRTAPHITQDDLRIFYSAFQLDMEAGTGLDGTGQGINPQAILQWSNDGGHSWSNELWVSIGAIGATRARAIWRRLGQARNRVFKLTITDPVKVVLMGAELQMNVGAS